MKHPIRNTLAVILLLIIVIFLLVWLFRDRTKPLPPEQPPVIGFSPFERPGTYQPQPTYTGSSSVFTYTPPPPPVTQPPTPFREPPVAQTQPQQTWQSTAYQSSFVIPTTQTTPEPSTYKPKATDYYSGTPFLSDLPTNNAMGTATTAYLICTKCTAKEAGSSFNFAEIDKEIFGYVTGLGWTQLLGDTGQQVFDFIYATTPQGTTNATLGRLLGLNGAGGGGGGLGFGAAGAAGALIGFGGTVTRVTYCTCSNGTMLDVKEASGKTTSVVYQNGASTLYERYNVYGTGQNVVGTYTAGGACYVYHGEDCTAEGSPSGTIRDVGTSATAGTGI